MEMQDILPVGSFNLDKDNLLTYLNSDELDDYEERSAIMEFHGGLSRTDAEFRALRIILAAKMKQAV